MSDDVPAGWYPDPDDGGASQRYWDGDDWTERVRSSDRPSPSGGASRGTAQGQAPVVQPGPPESRLSSFAKKLNGGEVDPSRLAQPEAARVERVQAPKQPTAPRRSFADGTAETIYLLRSIRAMMIFFTVLTVIGLILGIITVVHVAQAANNSGL